jgi:hypothetical protein
MTLPTFHIWHDTLVSRDPFTLFVFGPYGISDPEWDVEIYSGHITDEQRLGANYVGTVSSLKRDTHIIGDIWKDMDRRVRVWL